MAFEVYKVTPHERVKLSKHRVTLTLFAYVTHSIAHIHNEVKRGSPAWLAITCCYAVGSASSLVSTLSPLLSALNYYDLLGVKPDASLEEIKNAFFKKSKKLHPDSDPNDPSLHSQFVALNEAYRVLIREESRKEYDLRIRYRYHGREPFSPAYGYNSKPPSRSAEHAERMRYWEQFRNAPPQDNTAEHRSRQKKQNMRLVGYCVLGMLASVCIHYLGFRKLEEIHNNFMDEKDRVITQIYDESKERARINGFQKQTEILRQKHAEFLEKYKWRRGGDNK